MNKLITFTLAGILLTACAGEEKKSESKEKKEEAPKTETNDEVSENTGEPKKEIREVETKAYYGSFFKVDIPSDFTVSPDAPTDTYPESEKEFVQTDEATFTSPDGEVEFFIFSPQWGGPTSYTDALDGETITTDKTQENEDASGATTTTWRTFEPKDKSYTRACVIIEGDMTVKVFGIKFKSQKAYDTYKPEYLAFKKSLEQYAD